MSARSVLKSTGCNNLCLHNHRTVSLSHASAAVHLVAVACVEALEAVWAVACVEAWAVQWVEDMAVATEDQWAALWAVRWEAEWVVAVVAKSTSQTFVIMRLCLYWVDMLTIDSFLTLSAGRI